MSQLKSKYPDVPLESNQRHDRCRLCGGKAKVLDKEVEEEGTYQAKVTTFYECESCKRRWYDSERDWT
jgi:uncharacterized protein with PIN domain